MSLVVKFDEKYAWEEEDDFEDTLNLLTQGFRRAEDIDSNVWAIEHRLAYKVDCDQKAIDSAKKLRAGLMAYKDPTTGAYYLGLLRPEYKELFILLFHKVFMERNANKFMELRRLGDIPADFKPLEVVMLKEAA